MMDNMLSIHPLNVVSLNDGAATVLPGLCPSHALIVDVVRQVEWSVHDVGHEGLVPLHGKRLGEEVSEIVGSLLPCNDKVTLVNAVAQPVKSHVDGLGSLGLYRVVGHAHGTFIVAKDESGWLGVAENMKNGADPFADLGIDECGTILGFERGRHDHVNYVAQSVNGAINVRGLVGIAQEEVPARD